MRIIDSGSLHFRPAPCEPAVARTPVATDSFGRHAFHGGAMLVNHEPEQAPSPLPSCCQLFCRIEKEANMLLARILSQFLALGVVILGLVYLHMQLETALILSAVVLAGYLGFGERVKYGHRVRAIPPHVGS